MFCCRGILGERPGNVHDDHDGYLDVKRNDVDSRELWKNGGPASDCGDWTNLCHVRLGSTPPMTYNELSVRQRLKSSQRTTK